MRLPEDLEPRQREHLPELLAGRAELEPIYQLAQRFVQRLKQRDLEALEPWHSQAQSCFWSQLRSLARAAR